MSEVVDIELTTWTMNYLWKTRKQDLQKYRETFNAILVALEDDDVEAARTFARMGYEVADSALDSVLATEQARKMGYLRPGRESLRDAGIELPGGQEDTGSESSAES